MSRGGILGLGVGGGWFGYKESWRYNCGVHNLCSWQLSIDWSTLGGGTAEVSRLAL